MRAVHVPVDRLVYDLVAARGIAVKRHQGVSSAQCMRFGHATVPPHEQVIGRRMDTLPTIQFELDKGVSTNKSRGIEQAHDEPPVCADAVSPEQFALIVSSCHLLDRWGTTVNEGHAGVPAETPRVS